MLRCEKSGRFYKVLEAGVKLYMPADFNLEFRFSKEDINNLKPKVNFSKEDIDKLRASFENDMIKSRIVYDEAYNDAYSSHWRLKNMFVVNSALC
jgi:hypothetical protein